MKTTVHYLLSCSLQLQLSDESLWLSCHRRSWQNSTWASEMAAASARKLWRPQQRGTPPGAPGCLGCCKTSIYCILLCSKSQRASPQCYQVMLSSGNHLILNIEVHNLHYNVLRHQLSQWGCRNCSKIHFSAPCHGTSTKLCSPRSWPLGASLNLVGGASTHHTCESLGT